MPLLGLSTAGAGGQCQGLRPESGGSRDRRGRPPGRRPAAEAPGLRRPQGPGRGLRGAHRRAPRLRGGQDRPYKDPRWIDFVTELPKTAHDDGVAEPSDSLDLEGVRPARAVSRTAPGGTGRAPSCGRPQASGRGAAAGRPRPRGFGRLGSPWGVRRGEVRRPWRTHWPAGQARAARPGAGRRESGGRRASPRPWRSRATGARGSWSTARRIGA